MRTVKLNPNPTYQENFHLLYRRPMQPKGDSIWEFCGYRCLNCDRVIRQDTTLIKHRTTCKPHEKKYRNDIKSLTVYDKYGNEWEPLLIPFDMNQIFFDPETLDLNNDK